MIIYELFYDFLASLIGTKQVATELGSLFCEYGAYIMCVVICFAIVGCLKAFWRVIFRG